MLKPISEELINKIIFLYQKGHKISNIRKELSLGTSTVLKYLKLNNIPIRSANDERRKVFFNQDFFNLIDSSEKAYFLGLLYADGTVCKVNNAVVISLQEGDKDILEKFAETVNFSGKLLYIKRDAPRQNMFRLTLSSKKMCESLLDKGCKYLKTYDLDLPKISNEYFFDFLRGFMDGDGSICYSKGNLFVSFAILKSFGHQVKNFIDSYYQKSMGSVNGCKGKFIHQYMVGGNYKSLVLLTDIYRNIYPSMDRKRNNLIAYLKLLLQKENLSRRARELCIPLLESLEYNKA